MNRNRLREPAVFVSTRGALTRDEIREWAHDRDGGRLPHYSAPAFADWLYDAWGDFEAPEAPETPELTNEDVLKGALADWTGGRSR